MRTVYTFVNVFADQRVFTDLREAFRANAIKRTVGVLACAEILRVTGLFMVLLTFVDVFADQRVFTDLREAFFANAMKRTVGVLARAEII